MLFFLRSQIIVSTRNKNQIKCYHEPFYPFYPFFCWILLSPIIYFSSKVKIFFIYNLSTEKKNRLSPNSCCSRFSPFSFNLVLLFFWFLFGWFLFFVFSLFCNHSFAWKYSPTFVLKFQIKEFYLFFLNNNVSAT